MDGCCKPFGGLRPMNDSARSRRGALTTLRQTWQEILADIKDCLPARLSRRQKRAPSLRLDLEGPGALRARVVRVTAKGEDSQGDLDLAEWALRHDWMTRLAPAGTTLEIQAPIGQVLIRTIRFPRQVQDDLESVVGFEIDRLTPFPRDQVWYDVRILNPRNWESPLEVQLAYLPMAVLRPWVEGVQALDRVLSAVRWPGSWPDANLLPVGLRPRVRRRLGGPIALVLLVLTLMGVVLGLPLWQKRQVVGSLGQAVDKARGGAERVGQLRTQLEETIAASHQIFDQRNMNPYFIDILRNVTATLPDDAWVQNLELTNGEIQIRGEAARATGLLPLIEGSSYFEGAVFRSPVLQAPGTGRERFHLAFRPKSKPPASAPGGTP
ncbi:general secretion pathway protein L [Gammaproteobacteria bacterium]